MLWGLWPPLEALKFCTILKMKKGWGRIPGTSVSRLTTDRSFRISCEKILSQRSLYTSVGGVAIMCCEKRNLCYKKAINYDFTPLPNGGNFGFGPVPVAQPILWGLRPPWVALKFCTILKMKKGWGKAINYHRQTITKLTHLKSSTVIAIACIC